MASWLPWVNRRRAGLRARPPSQEWREIVHDRVPMTRALSDGQEELLWGLIQVFLSEKTFDGCGGLEITDEIRLTIAAQACLLIVGLEVDAPYPDLEVIRVYPSTIQVPRQEWDGWVVTEGPVPHLGLSSQRGYVVLSWDAARQGTADPTDGHNVVLHEFAHQLDAESGSTNGAPILPANLYRPWAKVLGHAHDQLLVDVHAARPSVLDPYGAADPAEFFAVATEAFFERSQRLAGDHPELYQVLVQYYRQDPATRRR